MDQSQKPTAKILGANGNVFNIMGIASQALKRAGLKAEASEMAERVFKSASYDEALVIILEYIEPE